MRGTMQSEVVGHRVVGYLEGKKWSYTFAIKEKALAENIGVAMGMSKITTYPIYKD